MAAFDLPPPCSAQAYCDVSALKAGLLEVPTGMFVTTAPEDERVVVPSLSFLIKHLPSDSLILFDLGIRRDVTSFPTTEKLGVSDALLSDDVPDSLNKGGLGPDDIKYVVLSHCDWDHIGDTSLFTKSKFVVGSECHVLFKPGFPALLGRPFFPGTLPEGRTEFLDVMGDLWKPLGPFPRALDYFGDGSLYLVDAPGHLPGHINMLVRTSSDGGWLYLAGDAAHDWRLVRGEGEIAMFPNAKGELTCIHFDKSAAEATIRRIAELLKNERVRVLLAHDGEWLHSVEGSSSFFPGKIASL